MDGTVKFEVKHARVRAQSLTHGGSERATFSREGHGPRGERLRNRTKESAEKGKGTEGKFENVKAIINHQPAFQKHAIVAQAGEQKPY